jgi:hypothetical protein
LGEDRSLVPWKHLAENLKESNRGQAEHIGSKLRQVHCFIAPRTDWNQPLFHLTPDEVEFLARMEHHRFWSSASPPGRALMAS